jgi:hypothetical protein
VSLDLVDCCQMAAGRSKCSDIVDCCRMAAGGSKCLSGSRSRYTDVQLVRMWCGTSDDKRASLVAEREVRLQSSHSHGFGAPLGKLCRISNGSFSGLVVPELIDSYQSTADSKHSKMPKIKRRH